MLRSLMVGDCDHYLSPYIFGVSQGMARLGHWHSQISIRNPIGVIEQRIADLRPHILWTHMLLWPPHDSPPVRKLVEVVERAARDGARVVIHDGDYKGPTRHAEDISGWCAVALCNHTFDRAAWKAPTLRWPYFAFAQDEIAAPRDALRCGLFFAGTIGQGPVYEARTALLDAVRKAGVTIRVPTPAEGNTLFRTAEIAASADAVLGFGRPGTPGWVDTRVFQYPGAGAILLHDDVGGYLEPWAHFVPYRSGDPDSVAEAMGRLRAATPGERARLRSRAFRFVQERHSSVARGAEVLRFVGLSNW